MRRKFTPSVALACRRAQRDDGDAHTYVSMGDSALLHEARPDEPSSPERKGTFGGKGIGFLASIALTVNNISGAGMLEFPQMFQRAGLVPSVASLVLVCIISTLFATTLADTVARIPHNKHFNVRIEFSDLFERYIGRRTALVTQAVFFLNLLSQNLAAIVATAQMFDSFAGSFWPGATYALRVAPAPAAVVRWDPSPCARGGANASNGTLSEACAPFASEGEEALLISAGYVFTLVLLAPLGMLTLEENMLQQKVSFVALMYIHAQPSTETNSSLRRCRPSPP